MLISTDSSVLSLNLWLSCLQKQENQLQVNQCSAFYLLHKWEHVVKWKFKFKKFPSLHPQFCIFFTVYCASSIVLIACHETDLKVAWVTNPSHPFSPTHISSFFSFFAQCYFIPQRDGVSVSVVSTIT